VVLCLFSVMFCVVVCCPSVYVVCSVVFVVEHAIPIQHGTVLERAGEASYSIFNAGSLFLS
jgi:hypothetical protein